MLLNCIKATTLPYYYSWNSQVQILILVHIFIGVHFYKAARLEPPPPLFKLLGFRASEPIHFFVTCNAYYEAVFCGLPNNKMTPNDIHANQTTSFVRIQQWKLQAVSRIVLEFFSTSRCLVA